MEMMKRNRGRNLKPCLGVYMHACASAHWHAYSTHTRTRTHRYTYTYNKHYIITHTHTNQCLFSFLLLSTSIMNVFIIGKSFIIFIFVIISKSTNGLGSTFFFSEFHVWGESLLLGTLMVQGFLETQFPTIIMQMRSLCQAGGDREMPCAKHICIHNFFLLLIFTF